MALTRASSPAHRALRRPRCLWLAALLLTAACCSSATAEDAPADAEATPVPSVAPRAEICPRDADASAPALGLIKVTPEKRPPWPLPAHEPTAAGATTRRAAYPRILCFVNTISVHHATRAQAVADTWGQRCDKLLFFSNASASISVGNKEGGTSRTFEVVQLDVVADHNHLWQKHKATLKYVYERFRHDFDWFYKADDDAYVVVENLRQYLLRPEILNNFRKEPMQMGHRFNLTQTLVSYYIVDDDLEADWRARWDRWVFNSGGPGYAMNRRYLDKIVSILPDKRCLSDAYSEMLPDDASISFCMMWHGVFPWDTRDHLGRERWHADKPKGVYYTNPDDPEYWYVQYHSMVGGVRWKKESCAPDSVAFHYISPPLMYHMERQLYLCRQGEDVQTVADFNAKYALAISDKAMVYQYVPPK
ncbi:Glycoprotein-n-acetylgalactosamine 3-beta-galactosyltransferase [Globisporangium polare]